MNHRDENAELRDKREPHPQHVERKPPGPKVVAPEPDKKRDQEYETTGISKERNLDRMEASAQGFHKNIDH